MTGSRVPALNVDLCFDLSIPGVVFGPATRSVFPSPATSPPGIGISQSLLPRLAGTSGGSPLRPPWTEDPGRAWLHGRFCRELPAGSVSAATLQVPGHSASLSQTGCPCTLAASPSEEPPFCHPRCPQALAPGSASFLCVERVLMLSRAMSVYALSCYILCIVSVCLKCRTALIAQIEHLTVTASSVTGFALDKVRRGGHSPHGLTRAGFSFHGRPCGSGAEPVIDTGDISGGWR